MGIACAVVAWTTLQTTDVVGEIQNLSLWACTSFVLLGTGYLLVSRHQHTANACLKTPDRIATPHSQRHEIQENAL